MVKIKTIVEVLAYRHALVMPTKSEAPRELEFPRGFCAQHHVRRWRALGLILGELLPIGIAPTRPLALSLHDLLLLQGPVRGYVRRLLEREPSKAAQQR